MPTETDTVLEFRSDRLPTIFLGLIVGGFGVMLLPDTFSSGPPIGFAITGVLLLVGVFSLFYRTTVRMDRRAGTIERKRETLGWKQHESYRVSDFTTVAIGMTTSSNIQGVGPTYHVRLLGRSDLKIPSTKGDKEPVASVARRVAEFLDLPVDEDP